MERLTSLDQLHDADPPAGSSGASAVPTFRPVFAYVDGATGREKADEPQRPALFYRRRGHLPGKIPCLQDCFIFNRDDHISPHVPSWAIRAVLTTDNIRLLEPQKTRTEEDTESWI